MGEDMTRANLSEARGERGMIRYDSAHPSPPNQPHFFFKSNKTREGYLDYIGRQAGR